MLDTLKPKGHFRPTNELKESANFVLGRHNLRWNDGEGGEEGGVTTTALPEGMVHEGIENVEALSEAYKSHKARTYLDFMGDGAKDDPNINRYKTGEELRKGFNSMSELVGKKGIVIPDEGSDDGVKQKYREAMGIPDGAERYKLGKLEDLHPETKVTPESLAGFKALMHKHGMSQKQAEGLYEDYFGMMSQSLNKRDENTLLIKNEAETALRNEWGKDFDENATIARRIVEKFGGKEAMEAFGDLGNKPEVMKFLSNLGKTISEDSFVGVGSVDLSTDSTGAKQRIKAIEGDPDFMDSDSPRHGGLVKERTGLYGIAYPST